MVNSNTNAQVNRSVSAQGLAVLRVLAETPRREHFDFRMKRPAGFLPMSEVLAKVRQPGVALSVARASLSRTVRRLWLAGLVELHNSSFGHSEAHMSSRLEAAREGQAKLEADPQASYDDYKAFVTGFGLSDRFGSVDAFLAAKREQANRPPDYYVRGVSIRPAGRKRLTTACTTELTKVEPLPRTKEVTL